MRVEYGSEYLPSYLADVPGIDQILPEVESTKLMLNW